MEATMSFYVGIKWLLMGVVWTQHNLIITPGGTEVEDGIPAVAVETTLYKGIQEVRKNWPFLIPDFCVRQRIHLESLEQQALGTLIELGPRIEFYSQWQTGLWTWRKVRDKHG